MALARRRSPERTLYASSELQVPRTFALSRSGSPSKTTRTGYGLVTQRRRHPNQTCENGPVSVSSACAPGQVCSVAIIRVLAFQILGGCLDRFLYDVVLFPSLIFRHSKYCSNDIC